MPKRIIDSDRLEKSEKLSKCTRPQRLPIGMLYPWLIARADRNGNFEIPDGFNPCPDLWKKHFVKLSEIWSTAVSDFHRRGLLFLYKKGGKTYAHVMGSEARGLLPKHSELSRFPTDVPEPPVSQMRRYASRFSYANGKPANRDLIASYSRQGIGLGENGAGPSPGVRFDGNRNGKRPSQRQLQRQRQIEQELHVGEGPECEETPEVIEAKRLTRELLATLAGRHTMAAGDGAPMTDQQEQERREELRRQADALTARHATAGSTK